MTVPGAVAESPVGPGVGVGTLDGPGTPGDGGGLGGLGSLGVLRSAVRQARAYCGPAHGRSWPLAADGAPASVVDVEIEGHTVPYRLVLHPRTRRPIRDAHGSFLYMPVRNVVVSQRTGS